VFLAGDKEEEMGKQLIGHGFEKTSISRCRERREVPRGGGGIRRNAKVWPKKLAGEFAGT
jgi:hypothetical protein